MTDRDQDPPGPPEPQIDDPPPPEPRWQTRTLLRAARAASLSTQTGGQPFVSLATPACAPDLSILMLLSELSEHTRHLRADPRCALMVAEPAPTPNPQTAPRVTVTGLAEIVPKTELKALKARWLAIHPYAALYADFGDFSLWRVSIRGVHLVGGFARAFRLKPSEIMPDPAAVFDISRAEESIISHCNRDHGDALGVIAAAQGAPPGPWRMVAADPDGCDLALEETVIRVNWSAPAADANGIRVELIRKAHAARNG